MFENMIRDALVLTMIICLWISLIPLYDIIVGEE